MSKNLMPEVAKLLGVVIGEEFKIKHDNVFCSLAFEEDGLRANEDFIIQLHDYFRFYENLLNGKIEIIKQPKLSQAERVILENLPKEYKWIARDGDNEIVLLTHNNGKRYNENEAWAIYSQTEKEWLRVFNHLFQFIK